MVEQSLHDLTLEQRVQRIEDIEQIRALKLAYARFCDAGYDSDGIGGLFAPDGVWDGQEIDVRTGPAAIADFFSTAGAIVAFSLHCIVNHEIDVAQSGITAKGRSILLQPITIHGEAAWGANTYFEDYIKFEGKWLFSRMQIKHHFLTRYDTGWVKEQFVTLW